MKFEMPQLPYVLDALEPVISKRTMEFHYGKHEKAYIDNLNKLIEGTRFEKMNLEEIILEADGSIFNNASQAWNHNFYFHSFSPTSHGVATGAIASEIDTQWGSFEEFKKVFVQAGITIFGSGWVWLVKNKDGKLEIIQTTNAGNPMTKGYAPLLTFDVWEHAYYLDYQNRRGDQLHDLFKIVNWEMVNERYMKERY